MGGGGPDSATGNLWQLKRTNKHGFLFCFVRTNHKSLKKKINTELSVGTIWGIAFFFIFMTSHVDTECFRLLSLFHSKTQCFSNRSKCHQNCTIFFSIMKIYSSMQCLFATTPRSLHLCSSMSHVGSLIKPKWAKIKTRIENDRMEASDDKHSREVST